MDVSEAVARRISVRAFLERPVPGEIIHRVIAEAARAPSGGNLQPWHIDIVAGEAMARFRAMMKDVLAEHPRGEPEREYSVYPPDLTPPYSDRRFDVGETMYATMGIVREDKKARGAWFRRNADFFGAPMALFCTVDRQMGPPQWSDLGMYLQTVMLLLQAEGVSTCAQEYWSAYPRAVGKFLGTPPERMLFTGIAIGYADPDHPANTHRAHRAALADFATFHGV
ncbi:nitroreductase family protein [Acuticoccus sediminis]|uniref:Nitroreductase family protein n=1 Tax=Acuticoccus sediminis TaxID=2184697 RepID=A0A8B2NZ69_9HYPH|nr:nitroreductase [Acuticoccus sediminis]RAI04121.1 nitroreductase family protein [Acuticoccus sediminis]